MSIFISRWAQLARQKFSSPIGAGRRPVMEHWLFVAALRVALEEDPSIAKCIYKLIDERTKEAMLDITKLKASLQALQARIGDAETREATDTATLKSGIADLKAKVGAGETVTQADLDGLAAIGDAATAHVGAMADVLDAAVADDFPPAPPAPPASTT